MRLQHQIRQLVASSVDRLAARVSPILIACAVAVGFGCDGPNGGGPVPTGPAARPATARAPAVDSHLIEGKWKVVFLAVQHATVSAHDVRNAFAIDMNPSLVIQDGVLTLRSASLTEALKIERLELPGGKAGEIDLEDQDSRNLFLGLLKLDGDRLVLRLHGGDRPADFTIRPGQTGSLVVAERVKD